MKLKFLIFRKKRGKKRKIFKVGEITLQVNGDNAVIVTGDDTTVVGVEGISPYNVHKIAPPPKTKKEKKKKRGKK